jgi:formate dehydrogenase subunit gamma
MAKMIQKSTAFERIVHWLLALSCLALLLTGLGFLYPQQLGWINTLFGGVYVARSVHNWGGIIFAVSLVLSLGTWVPECLKWSSDDSKWLGMFGGYLSKDSELPPQGKINAGQKVLGIAVLISGVIISISGLIIWLSTPSALWVLIHNICTLFFAILVPVHIYMATAANPGTFRIMTRGDIPLYWAKKKHPKWLKEIGAE